MFRDPMMKKTHFCSAAKCLHILCVFPQGACSSPEQPAMGRKRISGGADSISATQAVNNPRKTQCVLPDYIASTADASRMPS